MRVFALVFVSLLIASTNLNSQSPMHSPSNSTTSTVSLPSEAEIGELLDKATEYVATYRRTFTNAKSTLAKSNEPGFYQAAITQCDQANEVISTIKKDGSSGTSLLSILTILDDMSLNAAKASSAAMLVALTEDRSIKTNHGMQDFQDLAQAGKNCYDISELIFHATFRYVAFEDDIIRKIAAQQTK